MGASALYDALVFGFELLEGGNEQIDGGNDLVLDGDDGCNVHCGREGVVGGLAHVDVVIGVAELRTGDLVGAVCNDLVGVHVGLCARTCLPYDEREMCIQLAGNDLVAGGGDRTELFGSHLGGLQLAVGDGGSLLEYTESVNDLLRHGLDADTDVEVLMASLGLGSPVDVCGDFYFTHRIVFDTVFHFSLSSLIKNIFLNA